MEPIGMIIGALVMGMTAVAKDVGGQIVKDAYAGLKRVIVDRYSRAGSIAAMEEDPSSDTQRKALTETLTKAGLATDAEVLGKAKELSQALAKVPREALTAAGVRIGELEAINARFGDIEVSGGTGIDIGKATLKGDLTIGNVKVRDPN